MKGQPQVLDQLNLMLKEELTAINQYMLHAEMCENWGFHRLSKAVKAQAMGEMKHAEKLMERILFLDGMPQMQELMKLNIGKDVPQQIANDLALEQSAVASYNKAIAVCREAGDNNTADMLVEILADEEEHIDFLETQRDLIAQVGIQNYLARQMES